MSKHKSIYDVLVIGGGPAGTEAALTLKKHGAKVVLCDKARFPREKSCGGLLERSIYDEIQETVSASLLNTYTKAEITLPMGEKQILPSETVLVDRKIFDFQRIKYCISQAIPIWEKLAPVEIVNKGTFHQTSFYNGQTIFSKALIIATGNRITNPDLHKPLITRKAYTFQGFASGTFINETIPCVDFFKDGTGYGWMFPSKNGMNIGVYCWKKCNPRTLFHTFLSQKNLPSIEGKASFVPFCEVSINRTNPPVLYVGDAGGHAVPITGGGIKAALFSGRTAGLILSDINNNAETNKKIETFLAREKKRSFNTLESASQFYSQVNYYKTYSDLICKIIVK